MKNQHNEKPGDVVPKDTSGALSRRERQVMDILYRRGEATVTEVMGDLPDPPTYSAVRSILRILMEKELITHREDGPRYVYLPVVNAERARDDALKHVIRTFFDGSAEQAVAAVLRMSDAKLGDAEIDRLRERIKAARITGR
ncbi:MAG TPA: BlaI/MecI/CopY family transcriptional regulator [Gemmatimonadaceae bacterium]